MKAEFEFDGTLKVVVCEKGDIILMKPSQKDTAIYPEELDKFKEIIELAIKYKEDYQNKS